MLADLLSVPENPVLISMLHTLTCKRWLPGCNWREGWSHQKQLPAFPEDITLGKKRPIFSVENRWDCWIKTFQPESSKLIINNKVKVLSNWIVYCGISLFSEHKPTANMGSSSFRYYLLCNSSTIFDIKIKDSDYTSNPLSNLIKLYICHFLSVLRYNSSQKIGNRFKASSRGFYPNDVSLHSNPDSTRDQIQ